MTLKFILLDTEDGRDALVNASSIVSITEEDGNFASVLTSSGRYYRLFIGYADYKNKYAKFSKCVVEEIKLNTVNVELEGDIQSNNEESK